MEQNVDAEDAIDRRIAQRLRALRAARGWSLEELARRSGVSRASLSRLENAEVSATAVVLGKLCAAFGLPVSRLMRLVEEGGPPVVRAAAQEVWRDPETGMRRRAVSPPAAHLAGEVVECLLEPGTGIAYERPPRLGLEHHLWLVEGRLRVSLGGTVHDLAPGDCLRYRLEGASRFETSAGCGARYVLFLV